jgi:hypothetical protein
MSKSFDQFVKESAALIIAANPESVSPMAIHATLREKAKECGEPVDMEIAFDKVLVELESEEVNVKA